MSKEIVEVTANDICAAINDCISERDTYRQLCVDMLEALQYVISSDTVSTHVKYTVSTYINKAEQQLNGEKK